MPRTRLVDVADRAGVSVATASLVLRDRPGPSAAARRSVHQAAEELGYRVDRAASLLALRQSNLVGVALDIRSAFHAEMAVALDEAAAQAGLELILTTITPSRSARAAVATLVDHRCAGIVLLGISLSQAAMAAISVTLPAIAVGRAGRGAIIGVRAEDSQGLAAAVDHLVGLGHRRIGHICGPRGAIATARRKGFVAALDQHHLPSLVLTGGDTEEAGMVAADELLPHLGRTVHPSAGPRSGPSDPVTAVIAFNDRVAVGVREGLARHGIRVPQDLSLVGYDDSALARLATEDLTSVSQDPPALAAACIDELRRALNPANTTGEPRDDPDGAADGSAGRTATPRSTHDVVLAPHLVIRSSTQAPADSFRID
ncbi:MAG: LacI family DNA-binding transcriptional regulator [Nostocoides sp.]